MDLKQIFTIIPYKERLIEMSQPRLAWAYYSKHKTNLLTGEKLECDISQWMESLHQRSIAQQSNDLRVTHLFYEMGFIFQHEHLLRTTDLLAIEIEYSKHKDIHLSKRRDVLLKPMHAPETQEYSRAFKKGYSELLAGNCYQFNLTYPFTFKFDSELKAQDFISALWRNREKRGAYASATMIPFCKTFLSNSPECLFQYDKGVLATMPIKGTIKRLEGDDWRELWKN